MEIIHIVLGKANPERMNGVNKVVYQLATKQFEHGLDVSVWGVTKKVVNNYGQRVFKTELFQKKNNPFEIDDKLKTALLVKKGKATFHIHGGWVPLFSTIAKFLKTNNISYVFTPHGAYNIIAMQRNYLLKRIYFNVYEKYLIKNASKIHCIGSSEVDGLNKIVKVTNTILLPYGFQAESNIFESNSSHDKMIIGFVGRLDIYTKGLDLLLKGFLDFQKSVPNSELWIIGDGEGKTKLERLAVKFKLTEKIIFFGSKFGSQKNKLIKQMHVFTHPSRNEGLPSAVLEAANFGIPCVVSEATNVGNYVNAYKAGITIKNNSSLAIKLALDSIYDLYRRKAMFSMKLNAQKMVRESFNWQKLILQFNNLYEI
ncbi:MAG: glycosyltransferase [Bacteroidota bacterium]|nr:glycosyltransferase [Bacteroidota bacterium]